MDPLEKGRARQEQERGDEVKILIIDIETSPGVAHVWGLFKQTVSLNQLLESTRVICFAAKWHGSKEVEFYSDHHDGHERMIDEAWRLLDEADVLVHYNGQSFDVPHLQREFLLAGRTPTSPFRQVDLLLAVRKQFRFMSHRLQHVSVEVGLEGKVRHSGHQLWVRCMAGDAQAWDEMRTYNVQDVLLTEALYDKLLPWIPRHPHSGLYSGDPTTDRCSRCGCTELQKRGFAYTPLGVFQQYWCKHCGAWSRGGRALTRADVRGTA